MNLLIIGATGGTGRALLEQALARGHTVTVLVRNPKKVKTQHDRLTLMQGNVLDFDSVDRAAKGKDAVLSALGHKRFLIKTSILSEGTRNIVKALEKNGVKRFVCETSLGVGDSRGRLGLLYTLFIIPFILFFYFRDKKKQERIIGDSSLDWVIVRPGRLTNGRKRGVYRHGRAIGNYIWGAAISRADVADFMLKQLTDNSYLRQAVTVAY